MNLGGGGYIQSESGQDSFEYEEDTRSVVQTNGSHCMGLVDQSPQGGGTVGNRAQCILETHLSISILFFDCELCVP